MTEVRKALLFSVLAQNSTQVISLVTIAILARLLTPAEIGTFAVASSIAFLAIELRSLGVGQYLIREEQVNNKKIRAAIGLMMVVSWGIALVIFISAPFVADFYREQALATIFWIISGTFILAPFSSIPHAMLTREMQFQKLFNIRFCSHMVRSTSTIGFVLLGYSYYGLAMGTLVGAAAELTLITFYRPAGLPWLPSLSGFKKLLRFGLFTSAANTMQQIALSFPDLVLGRVASMADVGIFSRGLGLVSFLNKITAQAIGPVVLPHLSSVKREGKSVAEAYMRAVVLLASVTWPLFAVVNLSAYPIIRALFGDQWDAAVPIASILAIWVTLHATHSFASFALLTVERERLMFNKEIVIFFARLIAVLTTAPYGLLAVAWGMVASGVIEFLVNSLAIKTALRIDIRRQITALIPGLVVAAACWSVLKVLGYLIDFEGINPWLCIAIIGASMLVVWLTALWATKHDTWALVKPIIRRVF